MNEITELEDFIESQIKKLKEIKSRLNNGLLEIDLSKLDYKEINFLNDFLFRKFHDTYTKQAECKMILDIRRKWRMDIQENFMISDYEQHFNIKYE